MSIYTIKKSLVDGHLSLIDEHGDEVSALDILKACEPHRVFAFDGVMAPSTFQKESGGNTIFAFVSAEFKWDFNATFFNT